ncbi:hypothetical protein [Mesorhizobium sp.]|uniref:hypothetical protein n=1 Tax=Mesorhizobium sp. TaxID=1871066 RepID=UPI000FE8FBA1|nr:hypothetical protein [Mesorhizobium sp.]RWO90952.1 MAG: hypothetical protein EOQ95_13835 [Mesorhizobium sp.]
MLELKLKKLLIASEMLSSANYTLERFGSGSDGFLNDDHYVESLINQVKTIRSEMDNLQMGGVSVFLALERLEGHIKVGGNQRLIVQYITEFKKILLDELSGSYVLTLSRLEQRLFTQSEPLFGKEVANNFQSLTYEIEEIGKCLALGRSTAAAFHMLRCLEAAMRAIARCLGIPDPIKGTDRNWGNALKEISTETENRWPKATRIGGDGALFERFHATLKAMANPYRNATMHLEDKYTEEEARSLLEIVRGYLRSVAARMDQDGNPKA